MREGCRSADVGGVAGEGPVEGGWGGKEAEIGEEVGKGEGEDEGAGWFGGGGGAPADGDAGGDGHGCSECGVRRRRLGGCRKSNGHVANGNIPLFRA